MTIATLLSLTQWRAAEASSNAAKSVQAYAELFAFGASSNASAAGLSKDQLNDFETQFDNNLATMFRAYPLSSETFGNVKAKYLATLKNKMNIRASLKSKDADHPIVTLTAVTVNRQAAAQAVDQNKDLLTMAVMKRFKQNEGIGTEALRSDAEFQ